MPCFICRPEIVAFREANENKTTRVDHPKFDDPAFRALVEENVKDSVFNVIVSPVMRQHWSAYIAQEQAQNGASSPPQSALKPVYVHGE
jgi:carbonic anhydrase